MTGKAETTGGVFRAEPSANGMGVIVDGMYYAAIEFAELWALGPARQAAQRLAEIARLPASGKQE